MFLDVRKLEQSMTCLYLNTCDHDTLLRNHHLVKHHSEFERRREVKNGWYKYVNLPVSRFGASSDGGSVVKPGGSLAVRLV